MGLSAMLKTFLYMTFTFITNVFRLQSSFLNYFLMNECDAVDFVFIKHVRICVYSFLYQSST